MHALMQVQFMQDKCASQIAIVHLQCLPRFSLTPGTAEAAQCFLDVDSDGKPDIEVNTAYHSENTVA